MSKEQNTNINHKGKGLCKDCRFAKRESVLDYKTKKGFSVEHYQCVYYSGRVIKTSKDSCEHFETIPGNAPKKKCAKKNTKPKIKTIAFTLPCPFCGSDDLAVVQNSYNSSVMTLIKCRHCNASGSPVWSDENNVIRDADIAEAYLKWNERVGGDPQDWIDAIADGVVTLTSTGDRNGKHSGY